MLTRKYFPLLSVVLLLFFITTSRTHAEEVLSVRSDIDAFATRTDPAIYAELRDKIAGRWKSDMAEVNRQFIDLPPRYQALARGLLLYIENPDEYKKAEKAALGE